MSRTASQAVETVAPKSNPVYYHVQGVSPNDMLARNLFFLVGMPSSDYWINDCFPPEVWRKVEMALAVS